MICRKCKNEVSSELEYCPHCGTLLKKAPDMDEITDEIAGKVDMFMNEDVRSKESSEDGVTMVDGQMIADDDCAQTITRKVLKDESSDSVFSDLPEDEDLEEEEEPYVSEQWVREETDSEQQKARPKKKKKNTGVVMAIAIPSVVFVCLVIAALYFFGAFGRNSEEESTESVPDEITFSIEEGETYLTPLEITIESEQGNRLYYTLDGSTPSIRSSAYSRAITFDDDDVADEDGTEITLRVSSYTENSMKAGEAQISFTIKYADIETPVISPISGNYTSQTYITITAEEGAEIYYTYDGSEPTEDSTLYTGPIEMLLGNHALKAVAVVNGRLSQTATTIFNLSIASKYTFAQARDIVSAYLVSEGTMDEDGKTPEGGYVEFMDGGVSIIDNVNYLIVICDIYNEDDVNTVSLIYGVNDQDGTYTELHVTDSGYTK